MNLRWVKHYACCILIAVLTVQFSCIYNTSNPFLYDNLFKMEFTYCKQILYRTLLFRDSLPVLPDTFGSTSSLYESVLDPYTEYIDSSNIGVYTGSLKTLTSTMILGIEFDTVVTGAVVTYVLPQSQAAKKKILRGDTILVVNKDTLAGKNWDAIAASLNPKIGTGKTLILKRDTVWIVTVNYDHFLMPSVYCDSISDSIGYIFISAFLDSTGTTGGTSQELGNALTAMKWTEHVILDVRQNRGGMFEQAIASASLIANKQSVLIQTNAWTFDSTSPDGGYLKQTLWTDSDTQFVGGKQLHLLVDDSTAGAAEVFVSALKSSGVCATIAGYNTFGLGLYQVVTSTPGGMFAQCTNAHILTAQSESYHDIGIAPDLQVGPGENGVEKVLSKIIAGADISGYSDVLNRIERLRGKYYIRKNHGRLLCLLPLKK